MKTDLIQKFRLEAEAVESSVDIVRFTELNAKIEKMVDGLDPADYVNALNDSHTYSKSDLAVKKTGISKAFAGIAETGTLVFDVSGHDFLLSLLPFHHIAVLPASSIYPTLHDFLASANKPTGWVLVTGPSKTADIEQVLVYGVHGPVEESVIIIEDI